MKFMTIGKILTLVLIFFSCSKNPTTQSENQPESPVSPKEILGKMMRGINLGNTLEPPDEGGWNNGPAQEYYFDDYKSAGFTCVRIPVKWGTHTLENSPFTIDPAWINRVEQVVNWGLKRGLYIILNGHHEDWLKQDYSEVNKARYDSIWSQIAVRFKDHSNRLLFEMINEPFGMTTAQINDLNFRVLSIIRKSNPTRIVIYSGKDYSGLDFMIEAAIPADNYIMAYFHSYDPWSFAGQGNGVWGSEADRNAIAAMFRKAGDWSDAHDIPVMISEFGAVKPCEYNSRMLHYYTYVTEAINSNIAFQAWDDGGDFGIYNRAQRTWPETKDILVYAHPEGPGNLQRILQADPPAVQLTWQNRTTGVDEIIIERKMGGTEFSEIGRVAAGSTEYFDTDVVSEGIYYYRVIYQFTDQPARHSYPIKVTYYIPPEI